MRGLILLVPLLLGACDTAPPAAAPIVLRSVVALGDSVPAGSACGCDPFPDLYAEAQHAVDVNLAEPGYTTSDVIGQLPGDRSVLSSAAEVLLMIGANDLAGAFDGDDPYAPAAARVKTNVVDIVTTIEKTNRVPVIVLGYWNVVLDGQVAAREYGAAEVRDAQEATDLTNQALEEAATQTGAVYVSTVQAFHGDDGERDPTDLLAPDGDHPNAAGHAAIAALIPPLPSAGPSTPGRG
jgi:lysophospholipase L1-like esterase